jgi:hypothetical protein
LLPFLLLLLPVGIALGIGLLFLFIMKGIILLFHVLG